MTDNQRLYLHYIISRQKNEGNTQGLIRYWLTLGYDIRIVMPRPIMRHIIKKFGFAPSYRVPSRALRVPGRGMGQDIRHRSDPVLSEPSCAGRG